MSAKHPGNIYARQSENEAALRAAYPHQFSEPSLGRSWPDGWHRLVTEGCAVLNRLAPEGRWFQIKEKMGGLRLYYHGGPLRLDIYTPKGLISTRSDPEGGTLDLNQLNDVIHELEASSLRTCALCGGVQGVGRTVNLGGWWITICETCEPIVRAYRALPWGSEER